jgi:hypothetical protein
MDFGALTNVLEDGFAIAVAFYLLVKIDHRLNDLTTAVTRLEQTMRATQTKHAP